ncbi:MAG TPA: GNAT family N-acetyltransferase [Thermoleophilaceae bacterium]|nr:GNAT family N-acetyltransferase [Thermoleophilaceae bacterium]
MSAPLPPSGIDGPEIVDALERNQWEFIRGFAAVPGVEVIDDERSLRVATGVPSPLFNPVLRATVAPDEVPALVDEAREWYRVRRLPWSWYAGPASGPGDVAPELVRRGFAKVTEPPGMAADLSRLETLDPGMPITVARVTNTRLVDEWFSVFAPAFELSRAAASAFRGLILEGGLADDAPMRNYLAYVGSEPVATGSLVPAAGVGGIYNIATRANRRGRGIGRAITWSLMREARAMGYNVAILWSTAAGLPVYRRLGFQERVRVPTYLGPGG